MDNFNQLLLTLQSLRSCEKCGKEWQAGKSSIANKKIAESLIDVVRIELDLYITDVEKAIK